MKPTEEWVDGTLFGVPSEGLVELGIYLVLKGLGADLEDPHLQETPRRAAKAWYRELCRGLREKPPAIKVFPVEGRAEMVMLKKIPVRSICAHHLLPFIGWASVAYISAQNTVIGLSKLSRVVDYYARRPQTQERLTNQIVDALAEVVMSEEPTEDAGCGGAGVVIRANHLCMECRGVQHPGDMVTSALRGLFRDTTVRNEFLQLADTGGS